MWIGLGIDLRGRGSSLVGLRGIWIVFAFWGGGASLAGLRGIWIGLGVDVIDQGVPIWLRSERLGPVDELSERSFAPAAVAASTAAAVIAMRVSGSGEFLCPGEFTGSITKSVRLDEEGRPDSGEISLLKFISFSCSHFDNLRPRAGITHLRRDQKGV
jgi:hypothetical protein